jgi:hypothetical protein
MVLSVPARLQVSDVNLPVLRDRWLILEFLFGRHNPPFATQNTRDKYLRQVYFCG